MTRSQIIRHNAQIILCQVRGKTAAERRLAYAFFRYGPLGPILASLSAIPILQREVGP